MNSASRNYLINLRRRFVHPGDGILSTGSPFIIAVNIAEPGGRSAHKLIDCLELSLRGCGHSARTHRLSRGVRRELVQDQPQRSQTLKIDQFMGIERQHFYFTRAPRTAQPRYRLESRLPRCVRVVGPTESIADWRASRTRCRCRSDTTSLQVPQGIPDPLPFSGEAPSTLFFSHSSEPDPSVERCSARCSRPTSTGALRSRGRRL